MTWTEPLAREVKDSEAGQEGWLTMPQLREQVPRLEGESRSKWKTRMFQHKRKGEEAQRKKTK